MRMKGKIRGLSILELVFAMFMLSIAMVSVVYVYAGAIPNIHRSRILTQGAFLAQSIMEISLLAEPLTPVADTTVNAEKINYEPYLGFSYRVFVDRYPAGTTVDTSFYHIVVEVYHDHIKNGNQSIATCTALRKSAAKVRQAGVLTTQTAYSNNRGSIESMLSQCLEKGGFLQCSR